MMSNKDKVNGNPKVNESYSHRWNQRGGLKCLDRPKPVEPHSQLPQDVVRTQLYLFTRAHHIINKQIKKKSSTIHFNLI